MRVLTLTLAMFVLAAACGGSTEVGKTGLGGHGGAGNGGGGAGGAGSGGVGDSGGGVGGAHSTGGGGGHSGTGGAAGKDGGVDATDASSPGDGGALCPAPPAGIPGEAARCAVSCDPRPDGGGVCYGFPVYNAATTSVELWVAEAAAPQGGWRITLAGSASVTAGGHTYLNQQDGLVGTGGNGIYGDIYVARDGQAKWVGFHFEGYAAYQGGGVWDWPATVTVSGATGSTPATFGRHYTITRSGPCPLTSTGTYTFVADDPPRACASGWAVDLLSFTQPGA